MTEEKKDEMPAETPTEKPSEETPQENATPEETPVEEKPDEASEPVEEVPVEKPATEESTEKPDSEQGEHEVGTVEHEILNPTPKPEESVEEETPKEEAPAETSEEPEQTTHIYALRTTANREDQVLSFVGSNAARKKIPVYAAIAPHGMRGYIFLEAADLASAEQAAQGVPYAKGVIAKEIEYKEIEHMLEQVKREIKIQKNDIVEIIAGPFKRESAKISRVDKQKEEVVVELLEAAVPIPITLKIDDVKVIRREEE